MAKTPIRKTLEHLIKKVEELENQSFAQKLQIDELENKLVSTEEKLKQVQENPFNFAPTVVPSIWTPQPAYPQNLHVCTPGPIDMAGASWCTICSALMSSPSWTITSTTAGPSFNDSSVQSSSDVEPILDLDITWEVPDDFPYKD